MLIFLQHLCIFMTLVGLEQATVTNRGVILSSSLKQNSLCPEQTFAIFTCTAFGTDLTWLIGETMMSYNANARVGTLRSSQESDITATLLRKNIVQRENGYGQRLSVLTVNIRPSATEDLVVRCHNGSADHARNLTYLPRVPEPPAKPRLSENKTNGDTLNITWHVPRAENYISHYSIQVDNNPPLLVKNTSATILINSTSSHTIYLRAIDQCGQIGTLLDFVTEQRATTSASLPPTASEVTPQKVSSRGLKDAGIDPMVFYTFCIFLMYQNK